MELATTWRTGRRKARTKDLPLGNRLLCQLDRDLTVFSAKVELKDQPPIVKEPCCLQKCFDQEDPPAHIGTVEISELFQKPNHFVPLDFGSLHSFLGYADFQIDPLRFKFHEMAFHAVRHEAAVNDTKRVFDGGFTFFQPRFQPGEHRRALLGSLPLHEAVGERLDYIVVTGCGRQRFNDRIFNPFLLRP